MGIPALLLLFTFLVHSDHQQYNGLDFGYMSKIRFHRGFEHKQSTTAEAKASDLASKEI
jgi:hypothetical protein